MENNDTESVPKRRLQKKSGMGFLLPLMLLLIFLGGGYYLFFSEQPSQEVSAIPDSPQSAQELKVPSVPTALPIDQNSLDSATGKAPQEASNTGEAGSVDAQLDDGTAPSGPDLLADEEACNKLAGSVDGFFTTLDTRDYMQAFELGEKSNVYFPRLIQKLVDNPPVVTGETDDLFTILQNTAHFFRIIGKKNIFILKGILDREPATFEQTLADFYHLTAYPDCLKARFNLNITKDPLYYYAGFFLNTMGGRLYLFRRDSMSRMVVSFYAILIIDQANREGRNKYGIDISGAIDSLIDEIESSSIKLQMRDLYLDSLFEMKEKYQ